jgi:hypothetical protein
MFGTLLQSVLTTKVSLWVALILTVSLAYFVTRPKPQPQTVIEYRDYWRPPIISKPLRPNRIVEYSPVPSAELRVDTIFVPVSMTDYQLWRPQDVQQRNSSVVVRSFDIGTLRYRDYEYRALEAKFRANLYVSAYSDIWQWNPHVELEGIAWYRNVGAFTRVGVNSENPYVKVGIKYTIR